jgi:catechol 2,3-dioxygenase-like lactoylglutathione lyase family enzyme
MLRDTDAIATIAVKDLNAAAKFYGETLGLNQPGGTGLEHDQSLVFESGATRISVYKSGFAGTNKATGVTWAVQDVDDVVRSLRAKGVTFEHYDLPETSRQGDVHVSGDIRVAWFKDPDGNILSVVNR